MKTLAMCAVLALACGAGAPAGAIDVVTGSTVALPDIVAMPAQAVTPHALLPKLPEPDVVAMMLVGLVLIGYRASRVSDEKFT